MPRTGVKNFARMRIDVDNLKASYLPGETLTGVVKCHRDVALLVQNTMVTLRLFGRAKSKYVRKGYNNTSIYRGRAVFFDCKEVLFKGLSENVEGIWPFSITIPTAPKPGMGLRSDQWKNEPFDSYLSSNDDVTKHELPSVMYYTGKSSLSGSTTEAYIEYALVAECEKSSASLPLFIRKPSTPKPIENIELQPFSSLQLLKTPKLLPEFANQDPTFLQKSNFFFNRSKVPQWTFRIKVETPTIVQMDHPQPIPFRISVIPQLESEKTTIYFDGDLNQFPKVHLESGQLKLKTKLSIRCPSTFSYASETREHTYPLLSWAYSRRFSIPIIQPSPKDVNGARHTPFNHSAPLKMTSDPESLTQSEEINVNETLTDDDDKGRTNSSSIQVHPQASPLDIGKIFDVKLSSSGQLRNGTVMRQFNREVYPTFTTYNIKVEHELKWEIAISCAGEQRCVERSQRVRVLPPSEEQEMQRQRELGVEGMKKNYDDLNAAVGGAINFGNQVLGAITGF